MAPFGFGVPLGPPGAAPDDPQLSDLLTSLAQRTLEAQQAQQQAGSAYTSAASAPGPTINPLMAGLAGGLSRVAAGLGATQAPAQTAAAIRQQHAELTQQRLQNLASLQTDYATKAKQAQDIGDLETQIKYKSLADKVAQKRQELHETHLETVAQRNLDAADVRSKRASDTAIKVAQIHEAGQAARDAAKAAAAASGNASDLLEASLQEVSTSTGEKYRYADATNVSKGRPMMSLQSAANAQKLPVLDPKSSDTVKTAEDVAQRLSDAYGMIKDKLPESVWSGKGAMNTWNALTEHDPALAAYKSTRPQLIGLLQGMVTRGLRITDREVRLLVDSLPTLLDNRSTADQKVGTFHKTLDNIIKRNVTRGAALNGGGSAPAATPAAPAAAPATGQTVMMKWPDDPRAVPVPAGEVADAIRTGAKRIRQ